LIKYIIKALRGTSKTTSLNDLNDFTRSMTILRTERTNDTKNKIAKI